MKLRGLGEKKRKRINRAAARKKGGGILGPINVADRGSSTSLILLSGENRERLRSVKKVRKKRRLKLGKKFFRDRKTETFGRGYGTIEKSEMSDCETGAESSEEIMQEGKRGLPFPHHSGKGNPLPPLQKNFFPHEKPFRGISSRELLKKEGILAPAAGDRSRHDSWNPTISGAWKEKAKKEGRPEKGCCRGEETRLSITKKS